MDRTIIIRADDETMEALELVRAHEAQKRLEDVSMSELIRYLIKKEALLVADNKRT